MKRLTKTQTDKQPEEVLDLRNAFVRPATERDKEFCFVIESNLGNSNFFYAQNEKDFRQWLSVLKLVQGAITAGQDYSLDDRLNMSTDKKRQKQKRTTSLPHSLSSITVDE